MNLFLSRIEVDYRTARELKLWDDYRWHQALWQAFPNQPDSKRDFLSRVDHLPGARLEGDFRACFRAWLLSPTAPEVRPWGRWEVKNVPDSFLDHRRYLFSLRANPTKKLPKERNALGGYKGQGQSHRAPIVEVEKLRAWLLRQAEKNGFALDESAETGQPLAITKEPRRRLAIEEIPSAGGGPRIPNPQPDVRLHSVLFEGVLIVTNREQFRKVWAGRPNLNPNQQGRLVRGVGSAKGFGFGLLLLDPRPVSQVPNQTSTNTKP